MRSRDRSLFEVGGAWRYLFRLRWASLSKLSKSMESYLLLVVVGSKSSQCDSERDRHAQALMPLKLFPMQAAAVAQLSSKDIDLNNVPSETNFHLYGEIHPFLD